VGTKKTGRGKEVDNSELDVDSGAKPVENSEIEGDSEVPSSAKPPQVPKGKKGKKKAIRDEINIAAKTIKNGKWRDKYRVQPNEQGEPPLKTPSQPQAIGDNRRPLKRQRAMVFDEDEGTMANQQSKCSSNNNNNT
jgi:hypothetical protein